MRIPISGGDNYYDLIVGNGDDFPVEDVYITKPHTTYNEADADGIKFNISQIDSIIGALTVIKSRFYRNAQAQADEAAYLLDKINEPEIRTMQMRLNMPSHARKSVMESIGNLLSKGFHWHTDFIQEHEHSDDFIELVLHIVLARNIRCGHERNG